MAKTLTLFLGAMIVAGAAFAEPKVVGAGSLRELAGTPTLVTVVLKGGVKDTNLQVGSVNGTTIAFTTEKGEQAIYSADNIQEIQVQGGALKKTQLTILPDVLAPGDKQVVERAYERAKAIFDAANAEQNVKIQVAGLLALNQDEAARKYLQALVDAGELVTGLEACKAMHLAGMPLPDSILRQGLASGNRVVRGAAAELAGISKFEEAGPLLVRLAQDRAWEISGPACRAVARMGNKEIVPLLISELDELNDTKADAVTWSLVRLGDAGVTEQLRLRLPQASGVEKFRIAYLLYRLDPSKGKRDMIEVASAMPTLGLRAAIIMGADGDVSSMDTLRQHLRRREDETEDNLINRARAAEALVKGGDPSPKGVLQELMRSSKKKVRSEAFSLIVRLNNRTMLSLMQSSLENVENATAAEAATTAIALGNKQFRARLIDLRANEEAALGDRAK